MSISQEVLTDATAKIVTAYVGFNTIAPDQVPDLIRGVAGSLDRTQTEPEPEFVPAVSPRASLKQDALISLIDGRPYKMLKRHLANHGLTPEQYRERYNLRPDYPMVAPAYSRRRADLARQIGLGRKPGARRRSA